MKKASIFKYNVVVRREGKYYVAYVPALGISDFGESLSEARKNVKTAIECHIEGLVKTKSEVPAPDTRDFYVTQTEVNLPQNTRFAI